MALLLLLAPDDVNPGDTVHASISGGTPGAAFTLQYVGDLTIASGVLDDAGNMQFPFTVESTRPLGDYVLRAVTTIPGELDEFTLVIVSALFPARPVMVFNSYSIPKFGRTALGVSHSFTIEVRNAGLAVGEVNFDYLRAGSFIDLGTFTLQPGESHQFSATLGNVTELQEWQSGTRIAGGAVYSLRIGAFITAGNDPETSDQRYEQTGFPQVTPGGGGGGGIPPGYHVPAVGENPNIIYPVDQFRNAQDILQALVDSGYWANLSGATQNNVFAAPQQYIESHPLLNESFPAFFDIKITPLGSQTFNISSTLDFDVLEVGSSKSLDSPAAINWLAPDAVRKFYEEEMKGQATKMLQEITKLLVGGGPVDIDDALGSAVSVALKGMLTAFGIYTVSVGSDLFHPLKGTGIVPTAIDIVDKLGTDIFSRTIVGSYSNAFIDDPLRKFFLRAARPWRPSGQVLDHMLFQDAVTPAQWVGFKKLEGLPDDLIIAYQKQMFTEPSDRLLVSALEDPDTDESWLARKVKARGFNGEDQKILLDALKRRSQSLLRADRGAEVITRIKEGFVTPEAGRAELIVLGNRPDQADRILLLAQLKRDTEFRKEQLGIFKVAFQKDVITLSDFENFVSALLEDPDAAQAFIRLEVLRKMPKPKTTPLETTPAV